MKLPPVEKRERHYTSKFFVSDSYINNGLFWIMIACMQSVINNSQFSSHYDNENITYFKHLPRTY